MFAYLIRRLASMATVLGVVVLVTFFLLYLAPGDPAALMLGENATEENVRLLQREMGLDAPLHQQFIRWVSDMARGDFGHSIYYGQPVTQLIRDSLEPSLLLALMAFGLALLMGVTMGVWSSMKRGSSLDRAVMLIAVLGMSIPAFWLGLNFILLFSLRLRWAPVAGYVPFSTSPFGALHSLLLPAVAVAVPQIAWLARLVRSSMLDVLETNYVRTARGKGLRELSVIGTHALRNALLPVVTVAGIVLMTLFSSAVVVETVFAIPGIGRLVTTAVIRRDFPVVQGTVLFLAFVYSMTNLAVDLAYVYLDPRVKYGS